MLFNGANYFYWLNNCSPRPVSLHGNAFVHCTVYNVRFTYNIHIACAAECHSCENGMARIIPLESVHDSHKLWLYGYRASNVMLPMALTDPDGIGWPQQNVNDGFLLCSKPIYLSDSIQDGFALKHVATWRNSKHSIHSISVCVCVCVMCIQFGWWHTMRQLIHWDIHAIQSAADNKMGTTHRLQPPVHHNIRERDDLLFTSSQIYLLNVIHM